jgi:predicted DNA-binding antitoxin AbrB/MazE fold protein
MIITMRARIQNGNLVPGEKLNLPEGKEVELMITEIPSEEDVEKSQRAAGGWKGLVDAENLIRNIYRDRLVRTRPKPRL